MFTDPFLGNPNNFCGASGFGCDAANAPGYLAHGDPVGQGKSTFPVDFTGAFDTVVAAFTGINTVTFGFTSITTSMLVNGALNLDLNGTFLHDSTGDYLMGQAAHLSIGCTQAQPGGSITCLKSISSPPAEIPGTIPEPASLALLGSALLGFGVLSPRRKL